MVKFYGNGSVFMPKTRRFVRFIGGEYSTDDAYEVEILAGKYKHDVTEGKKVQFKNEPIVEVSTEIVDYEIAEPKRRGRKPKDE